VGERWYDTIGPLNNTALGKTKDVTLIAAAFKSKINHETADVRRILLVDRVASQTAYAWQ